MTNNSTAKRKRQRPVEDEAEMLNPLHYENDVLHVYGVPLKPHADFPWLWSTNSLLEAVLRYQRGNGVSEASLAKFKKTKLPGPWLREKRAKDKRWLSTVRTAGRAQKHELSIHDDFSSSLRPKLSVDYALQTKLGRSGGVYLCASLIVAYCRYLHPEFGALVDDFFSRGLRGSNSVIAEVQVNAERNRSSEEILEEDSHVLHQCRAVSKERGANPQAMVGQATVGFLGEKLSEFASRHGIKHPHRKNLIRAMPDVGDGVSSSVRLGSQITRNSKAAIRGDVKVGQAYNLAGTLTRKFGELDSESGRALLAYLG